MSCERGWFVGAVAAPVVMAVELAGRWTGVCGDLLRFLGDLAGKGPEDAW